MKLIELIDYDHHQSGIALYKSLINGCYFYEKHSFSNCSDKLIQNEFDGYKWYYDRNKIVNKIKLSTNHNNKIIVPEFNGVKLSSLSGIEGNEFYIEKILHLYMKTWNSKDSFAIHGDFAFGNFIFSDNEVHIIDWEHFHKAKIQNYGYDFVHFIFLCLKKDSFRMSNYTKSFLRNCFTSLRSSVLYENTILEKPFQNSNKYIKTNLQFFFKNKIALNKFEFSNIDIDVLSKIDLTLT